MLRIAVLLAASSTAVAHSEDLKERAPRLRLAFTEQNLIDPGLCALTRVIPDDAIVWSDDDVTAFSPQGARWLFDPARKPPETVQAIGNRCFVLTVDGQELRGIALPSQSARLVNVPVLNISSRNQILSFQLTAGNQGKTQRLLLEPELASFLGSKSNARFQMMRTSTPSIQYVRPWQKSVQVLIDSGEIFVGMAYDDLQGLLGKPTSAEAGKESDFQQYRWRYDSPMQVNPFFLAAVSEDKVMKFRFSSGP